MGGRVGLLGDPQGSLSKESWGGRGGGRCDCALAQLALAAVLEGAAAGGDQAAFGISDLAA